MKLKFRLTVFIRHHSYNNPNWEYDILPTIITIIVSVKEEIFIASVDRAISTAVRKAMLAFCACDLVSILYVMWSCATYEVKLPAVVSIWTVTKIIKTTTTTVATVCH